MGCGRGACGTDGNVAHCEGESGAMRVESGSKAVMLTMGLDGVVFGFKAAGRGGREEALESGQMGMWKLT